MIGVSIGSFGNNIISYYTNGSRFDLMRSTCYCGERSLKIYEVIPIISYLSAFGKCRECKSMLPGRYLALEIFLGVIALLVWVQFGYSFLTIVYFLSISLITFIALIDYRSFIIPNKLVAGLLVLASFRLAYEPEYIVGNIITSIFLTLLLFTFYYLYKKAKGIKALGFGDIKYIAVLCLLVNFPLSFLALWLSTLLGLTVHLMQVFIFKSRKYNSKIPFGTYLSIGYSAMLLFGHEILEIYYNIIMID